MQALEERVKGGSHMRCSHEVGILAASKSMRLVGCFPRTGLTRVDHHQESNLGVRFTFDQDLTFRTDPKTSNPACSQEHCLREDAHAFTGPPTCIDARTSHSTFSLASGYSGKSHSRPCGSLEKVAGPSS